MADNNADLGLGLGLGASLAIGRFLQEEADAEQLKSCRGIGFDAMDELESRMGW